MKPLTLLVCLFFLGCEKRVADPEIEAVKEWLLSEKGQREVANQLDQVPCENWVVKRAEPLASFALEGGFWPLVPGREFQQLSSSEMGPNWFALYSKEKLGDRGRLVFVNVGYLYPARYSVAESEFEDLGDPVSMEKARAAYLIENLNQSE